MTCEDYKQMVQEFNDRELEKGREMILFTHLASCEDCRDFMKNLNLLNSFTLQDKAVFPDDLDGRILREVEKRAVRKTRPTAPLFLPHFQVKSSFLLYAAAVFVVLAGIFIFNRLNENERKLQDALKQIDSHKQNIEAIMNSMPEVEIKPKETNQIIINAKM